MHNGPFAVVVGGTDASGAAVQRQFPTVFRAQTVEVTFDYERAIPVLAGSSRQFAFHVRNAGASPASFTLNSSSSLGTVRDIAPSTVTLAPGSTAVATFYLDRPADATVGDLIELRMSASNTADAALYNGTSAEVEVADPADLDGDRVLNIGDNCPNVPNASQIDRDGEGTCVSMRWSFGGVWVP